jgi:hypothetical protein
MAYELVNRWTNPQYLNYIDLYTKHIEDTVTKRHGVRVKFGNDTQTIVQTEEGFYKLKAPVYNSVDGEISKITEQLRVDGNTFVSSIASKSLSAKHSSDTKLSKELAKLVLYKSVMKENIIKSKTAAMKDLHKLLKHAIKQLQDPEVLKKQKKYFAAVGSVVTITRSILKVKDDVTDGNIQDAIIYISDLPRVKKVSSSKAAEIQSQLKNTTVVGKKSKNKQSGKDVIEQNERIRDNVLPMLSPFKIIRKHFTTEEQCKSTSRSQPYFVLRKDLVSLIKDKDSLAQHFTGIDKMNKGNICEKLFNLPDKKIKN